MSRRFVLRGDEAALAVAMDRVHVACEVQGAVEREGEVEVWCDRAPPDVGDLGVACAELPIDAAVWTGLEADAPIRVADDLLVRPPWVPRQLGFVGLELVVPRAMAFGSGEHGSTQAALCALREVWPETPPATFADVGTGSGILALYGALRGARAVLACDVEPEAVAAARELVPAADVRQGGAEVFGAGAADLVVANLDARQLDAALAALLAVWSRRAPLVLSGMRPGEVGAIARRVPAAEVARVERHGFVAVAFTAR